MKRIIIFFIFSVAVLAWGASTAVAELAVFILGGDKIVEDQKSGLYWYPHLMDSGLVQKTKAEQYAFIDGLNQNAYGGRSSWRFATLNEMLAMIESMTDAPGITCGSGAPGPGTVCSPVPILDYFEETGYYNGSHLRGSTVLTGRTADEWALREDPEPLPDGPIPPYIDHTTFTGSVEGTQWGEGEYHIPYNPDPSSMQIRYDGDTNYIADHQLYGPLPNGMPAEGGAVFVCSAWIVAEPPPIPTLSGAGLLTLAMALGGAAFFAVRRRKRAS